MKRTCIVRNLSLCAAVLLAALAVPPGAMRPAQGVAGLAGPQPFLVILCRFADAPEDPAPPAFFEHLLFGPAPSLDDYWRSVSGGRINLAGSRVVGGVTLPQPVAGYQREDGEPARGQLAADCINAAGQAGASRQYAGIVVVFNRKAASRPCAGELRMNVDGKVESRRVIWMWPASMRSHSSWAHEMGHVFGLDHSSDNSNAPYANPWDVMSDLGGCACGEDHTAIAQYPLADDLQRLGWIEAARVALVGAERDATIDLAPLSLPGERGALLVRVPAGPDGRYYTVEARTRAGYDAHLPGDAVIIHRVDPACPDHPAHLVTHPGEPLTAAAGVWREGETFTDAPARVAITVEARRGVGFRVTVRTGRGAFAVPSASEPPPASTAAGGWRGGKLLALGLAAGDPVYAAAAQETTLGMSPAIEVAEWRAGKWGRAERLPAGWSSLPGDAPAVVMAPDGMLAVAWSGAAKLFPAMGYGGMDADIWLDRRDKNGWADPVRVNDDAGMATQLSPALAQGPKGALYLAWEDQRSGRRDIYFAEIFADGRFSPNRRLNDDATAESQTSPALAADAGGNVTAVWVDWRSGASEIYSARRDASGKWGANVALSAAGPDAHASPAVTTDGQGNAYAAWVAYPACGRARGEVGAIIAAFRPVDGEWQPAEMVADAVHGGVNSRPVIAAAPAGRVYLAWEERRGAEVVLRLAQRDAGGWTVIRSLLTGADKPAKPALAVDAAGAIYLAWLTEDGAARSLTLAPDGAAARRP